MTLFFLADIHGSEYYLAKAMDRFEKEGASFLVLVGDLLYHGPRNPFPRDYSPAKVAEMLNELDKKIIAIRGNCDSDVDQMVLSFPMLSDHGSILINNKRIFLSHGHVYNSENLAPLNRGDIFVTAHTHIPEILEKDGVIVFNPGSISLPKGGSVNSYGVMDEEVFVVKDLNGNVIKEKVAGVK